MAKAKCYIYWNLHKDCFSVRYRGKVIAHIKGATVFNAEFRVSEAGRQRVLAEKRKNVHAFVACERFISNDGDHGIGAPITYNPYKYQTFVKHGTEEPVTTAQFVSLLTLKGRPLILAEGINTVGEEF
jgi:hypothetical protein